MPKRQAPQYEQRQRTMWLINASQVQRKLREGDKELLYKIRKHSERSGFPMQVVMDKVANDMMYATWFAKSPTRQSMHEKIALEWLDKEPAVSNLAKLNPRGNDALYVSADSMIQPWPTKPAPSKSLDFRWTTGRYTIYASHKYAKENGGAQDSQFNELRRLLENFQAGREHKRTILLAIGDGDYYTDERMEYLRNVARMRAPYSNALHIEEVPGFLASLA